MDLSQLSDFIVHDRTREFEEILGAAVIVEVAGFEITRVRDADHLLREISDCQVCAARFDGLGGS